MMKLLFSLLLLLSITSSNGLFDSTNYVQKVSSALDFTKALGNLDFLTAVLFYRNTPEADSLEPAFVEFAETKKDFYRAVAVDCDQLEQNENRYVTPACNEDFRDKLPQITFLEPQTERIDPKADKIAPPIQHRYEGPATVEGFAEFAKKIMPNFSKRLASLDELDGFLAEETSLNKALFLTNKKTIPQYWKALTSKFKGSLAFGEALSKGLMISEKYGVEEFPAVLVLTTQNEGFKENFYKGELDYESLEKFLSRYAAVRKSAFNEEESLKEKTGGTSVKKIAIKNVSPENFEQSVYGTAGLVLIHFFKGNEFHKTFSDLFNKYNEMIEVYNFNCTEASAQKFSQETLQIKSVPAYRLYPIGNKATKSKSKIIFSKAKKLKEIGREISDLIEDPTVPLDPMSLSPYLESVISTKKPAVILFHNQDDISLSLRVLARLERYKNWIRFASYKNPSAEVRKQFSIESLPKISVAFIGDLDRKDLTVDDIQTAVYTGKFSYNELRYFFDTFLPASAKASSLSTVISQIDRIKEFKTACLNKAQGCVIGLLDGFAGNVNAEIRVRNELVILENAKINLEKHALSFVWVDGACHPEFLKTFDITLEQLPTVVYYDTTKKTSTQLMGPYEQNNILKFVQDALKGEGNLVPIAGIPKLETKSCGVFHQQRRSEVLTKLSPSPREEPLGISADASIAHKFKEIPADRDEL